MLCCACCVLSGFLALIAFEEADAALRGLPPPLPPPTADSGSADKASSASLEAERSRLMAVRHHCMVALLDQLDVLSLPPLSLPPDLSFLRSHLLHMLYSVGKGRLLLLRCLMRLPHPHTFDIVSLLASNLAATCTPSSRSRVDEQFAVLAADVLYAAPVHTANIAYSHFIQPNTHSQLVAVVRSKMGCMFLQVLAKKGQDMRQAYDTAQQQQQPPPPSALSPSSSAAAVSSPRLSSVSADFAVWSSLTGELLRLLSGQWAAVFEQLPNNATTASHTATKAAAAASSSSSSSPQLQLSLASARAMWDLVALLLSHITAAARHTPTDEESEQASQQLSSLIAELRPLMRRYLISTYQLEGGSEEKKQVEQFASASASAAGPAASPVTAAAVVAASTASESTSAPKLLPPPHSSLLYACSVLLPSDDIILPAAQTAHRRSEESVRAFIAAKQARLAEQYSGHRHGRPAAAARYHAQPQLLGGAPTALREQNTRGSSQHHSANGSSYPQQRRAPPPQQKYQQAQQHPSSKPTEAVAQQSARSKSQPGSYAFAAAWKA